MALLMELGRMQQMGGVPGAQPPVQMPNNGNVGQQITQQMNPPMQSQINDQLKQQIPQMMQTQ
jgi:hypothetical protein